MNARRADPDGTVLIRMVSAGDVPSVVRLFRRFMREIAALPGVADTGPYVERAVSAELSRLEAYYLTRPRQGFWVMTRQARVIGCVGVERVDERTAELRRMLVDTDERRQGRGRALLAHAERFCIEQGYDEMVLGTSTLQTAAVSLYERAGYCRIPASEPLAGASHKTLEGAIRVRYGKRLESGESEGDIASSR